MHVNCSHIGAGRDSLKATRAGTVRRIARDSGTTIAAIKTSMTHGLSASDMREGYPR